MVRDKIMKIILRESQLEKCMLTETKNCDVFSTHTTAQDYDDVLLNVQGRYQRSMEGKVVQMTPEEYLDRCAQLQGNSIHTQHELLDRSKIRAFAERMSKGEKFALPYIDYYQKQQEGRHRVMAAKYMGCQVVNIGVFNEEGREDPYSEGWDEEREYTLEDLQDKLSDVFIDPQGVFVSYIHDWNHPKDVNRFLNLYPDFEGKGDLFYQRMGVLWQPEHTNEFEFGTDHFVCDEDPQELTNYIWAEILSHTTEEQLSAMGYDGDPDMDFSEVCSWLYSVARELDVLKDLDKRVNRMLNAVFIYTFYRNNWNYFHEVSDKYHVVLESEVMKVYSTDKYMWDDRVTSGKELLEENQIQISFEEPVIMTSHGYYLLAREDIENYLGQYPMK